MPTQTLSPSFVDPRVQPAADVLAAERCPGFPESWSIHSPVPVEVARQEFLGTARAMVAAADAALLIKSVEELEQLPIGSQVRSKRGNLYEKVWTYSPDAELWAVIGGVFRRRSSSIDLPAVLIGGPKA
jgi:hypothetical protein